ncbi:hypothetical protein CLOM_g20050 [Closterium sp. NIES-68]|nr:hypothetical protein CLOM_g20050 [Closterium sp. NIES-68]GJP73926.1 hypothetical protein CLOP_g4591 [Closterium sp. NIES-67]
MGSSQPSLVAPPPPESPTETPYLAALALSSPVLSVTDEDSSEDGSTLLSPAVASPSPPIFRGRFRTPLFGCVALDAVQREVRGRRELAERRAVQAEDERRRKQQEGKQTAAQDRRRQAHEGGKRIGINQQQGAEAAAEGEESRISHDLAMFVGGPIWALDWCPLPRYSHIQYLAVASHPHLRPLSPIGLPLSGPALVQVGGERGREEERGPQAQMVLGITHHGGLTRCARWRPLVGGRDCTGGPGGDGDYLQLLAVALGDGTVAIYHVTLAQQDNSPRQNSRLQQHHHDHMHLTSSLLQPAPHGPLCALQPVFKWKSNPAHGPTRLPCELAWKVTSAPVLSPSSSSSLSSSFPRRSSDLLAAGFHDGSVSVWRLQLDHLTANAPAVPSALSASKTAAPPPVPNAPAPSASNPILTFRADSALIRSLTWLPSPLPSRDLVSSSLTPSTPGSTPAVRVGEVGSRTRKEARNGKHLGKEGGQGEEDEEEGLEDQESGLEDEEEDGKEEVDEEEESTVLIVGSQSGILKFWDLRDVFQPAYETPTISRHGVLQLDFCSPLQCVVLAMEDGSLRVISMRSSPSHHPALQHLLKHLPEQQQQQQGEPRKEDRSSCNRRWVVSALSQHTAAVWGAAASDATGCLAFSAADGLVRCVQLSNNFLINRQKRSKQVVITVGGFRQILLPHAQSGTEAATADATADEHHFVFYRGESCEEQEGEIEQKGKGKPKKGHVGGGEEVEEAGEEPSQGVDNGTGVVSGGVLGCKAIAMHRVAWNANRGFRRWLANGGANGVLRCQLFHQSPV